MKNIRFYFNVLVCLITLNSNAFANVTFTRIIDSESELTANKINPALGPELEIRGNNIEIIDGATSSSVANFTDFGLQDVNSGSKIRTFVLKNIGDQNIIFGTTAVQFTVNPGGDFSIVSGPINGSTLLPGASINLVISFNPSAVTTRISKINVNSNDANESPYDFVLEGDGALIYPDSDGDGISNNIDVDDDNDGIRDSVEQLTCQTIPSATNVTTEFLFETFGSGLSRQRINGTTPGAISTYFFEDGTNAQAPDEMDTNPDLNDGKYTVHYSVSDNISPSVVSNTGVDLASYADWAWYKGLDHTPGDTNGRMAIFNASFAPGVFYETTITGIIPNVPINYSFWALNIDNNDAAFIAKNPSSDANHDGVLDTPRIKPNITVNFYTTDYSTLLATFNTGNITRCSSGNSCALSEWKNFITNATFNVTEFIIQFKNNAPGGGGNDIALDDIQITQTLCDVDNDGVPDVLDLDNDNDGIPNIFELSLVDYDVDRDAMTSGAGWVDVNNNGMSDIFETLTPMDYDGDGVPNFLDLDSDNDSIYDNVEYDGNGDIDINGDGLGDGNDISIPGVDNDEFDGDGILGIADTNDSDVNAADFGNNGYLGPIDSDGDGLVDILDVTIGNGGTNFVIAQTIFANLDTNNDGKIDGSGPDADFDGILALFDSADSVYGNPRDIDLKTTLYFDGRNDYVEENTSIVNGLTNATLMAWVKIDTGYNSNGVVVGQENFYLSINSQDRLEVKLNTSTFTMPSVNALIENKWYHIAASYSGGQLKTYIDGVLISTNSSGSLINSSSNNLFRIGSVPLVTNGQFFKGQIDEVRVFNAALTDDQIQKMVYQEIHNTNFDRGLVIPKNIPALSAASLIRYFRMDTYKHDILDNLVTPAVDTGVGAKILNVKNILWQTAPLPYQTIADGTWSTNANWKNNAVNNMPQYGWSIVEVNNNISINTNFETAGLIINSSKTLSTVGNIEVKNNWYVKLDGKIDLNGLSQLVQTQNSDLDVLSSGILEREQKGTANLYNYNYWSSPVSTSNATTLNHGFSINNVFKDATNPISIINLNFNNTYNGSLGTPVSISRMWFYKFQNLSNAYANWTSFNENSVLTAGSGFTMKGVANLFNGENQNYAFVGKPNNGNISLAIAANNLNLTGNPYPSAIDSRQFILDNIDGGNIGSSNALTGTIYFWQHANENNSHLLAAYKGGYATLNLVGGVGPMVVSTGTFGLGTANKIPNRFIPVGQGFFVTGDASGGTINYKNSQRAFKIETDASSTGSNTMFKNSNENSNSLSEEAFKKLRVDFQSTSGHEKEILVGFMDTFATDDIDIGYDSEGIDSTPSDFYFNVVNKKLIIQGVGAFQLDKILPVTVVNETSGIVKFKARSLENFDVNQEVYLFDNETNLYHQITNQEAQINLIAGTYTNRFSITFSNGVLNVDQQSNVDDLLIYSTNSNNVVIEFKTNNLKLEKYSLFNILGQQILSAKIENNKAHFDKSNLATGTYIVKVESDSQEITKKIIIN